MPSSRYPQITDELLSAYIDDAVTKEEKTLIETAIVDEPAIAWRLETLRYTINLLSSLPTVALPRSFALSEFQATGQAGARTVAQSGRSMVVARAPAWRIQAGWHNLGERWQNFWQIGNLFLRNAAAVSLAIFLVLIVSNALVTKPSRSSANVNSQSSSNVAIVRSDAESSEAQKTEPTVGVQASKAESTLVAANTRAVNDLNPALAQSTMASQVESVDSQAAPASSADSSSAPSITVLEAPAVAAAAALQPDSARAGTANSQENVGAPISQPGPDNSGLGEDGFAPSPPAVNAPAAPFSAAPSMHLATPKTAESGIQSAPNSPLIEPQSALQAIVVPTPTMTATTSIIAYNDQSQATVAPTSIVPTLTPAATITVTKTVTKTVTNNQVEVVQTVTSAQANGSPWPWSWLSLAQLMSAFATLILGTLWWRSGESQYRMKQK